MVNNKERQKKIRSTKNPINIVHFEDSKDAVERFNSIMKGADVKILPIADICISTRLKKMLIKYTPQLIVVDLMLDEEKYDGYNLIKEIQKEKEFKDIPLIVYSKFINGSLSGEEEKKRCKNLPGVVAVFGKVSDNPTKQDFLKHVRR